LKALAAGAKFVVAEFIGASVRRSMPAFLLFFPGISGRLPESLTFSQEVDPCSFAFWPWL
jgi:hypothetical protein